MAPRILVVEDDPLILRIVALRLQGQGYEVLTATDGEEALDMATRERPDLIIMDIQLPKLNGLEVTRKLRGNVAFSQIPIIALTAYAMKGDKERAIEAGCDAYLSKPIDTRQLPGMIAEMLLQQQKANSSTNGDSNAEQDPSN